MEKIPTPQAEVIHLPEDRELLQRKLAEYNSRFKIYTPPEMQLDTVYKIAVLEPLVRDGVVHRTEIAEELRARFGSLDERRFHTAWGVITDYVTTGGRNVYGGTGLPYSGGGGAKPEPKD